MNRQLNVNYIQLFILFNVFSLPAICQIDYNTYKKPGGSIFLDDVFIHENGDKRVYKGDIIIRDGIIEKVGLALKKPFDAITFTKDSLFVYPGFIDFHSFIKNGEEESSSKKSKETNVKFPGNPPDVVAGITPWRNMESDFEGNDGAIVNLRKAGFCISQFSYSKGMMPGYTSIFSLGTKSNGLLESDKHLFSQFKGAGRNYPSTVIGIIAKWKDLYRAAKIANNYKKSYDNSKLGLQKPTNNKTLEALFPIIDGESRVVFNMKKKLDIFRAVDLSKELDFPITVINIKGANPILNDLPINTFDMVLSSDLPKKKTDIDSSRLKIDSVYKGMLQRQEAAIEDAFMMAGELESLNKSFAFSMSGSDPNQLKANLLEMIHYGLSPSFALKALTQFPAEMLDLEDVCGTITKGKLGNLVLSQGDYFSKNSHIIGVVIEGEIIEFDGLDEKDKDNEMFKGKWDFLAKTSKQKLEGTLNIEKINNEFSIKIVTEGNKKMKATNVKRSKESIHFDLEMDEQTLSFDLVFEKNKYSGKLTSNGETYSLKGKKKTPK